MVCAKCTEAADTPGLTQTQRDKLHKKCIDCTCEHKPQGSWKGIGNE